MQTLFFFFLKVEASMVRGFDSLLAKAFHWYIKDGAELSGRGW